MHPYIAIIDPVFAKIVICMVFLVVSFYCYSFGGIYEVNKCFMTLKYIWLTAVSTAA